MSDETGVFKGRERARVTPRSVRVAERTARWLISLGGIGTILAVSLIFLFLVWVVVPLFRSGEMTRVATHAEAVDTAREVIAIGGDEQKFVGWALQRDGTLRTFRIDDGTPLGERKLFEGRATAWSTTPSKGGIGVCVGFADGTIRTGKITFDETFLSGEIPERLRRLERGESTHYEDTMVYVTPKLQYRVQRLVSELGEPFAAMPGTPIASVDHSVTPLGEVWAVLGENAQLTVYQQDATGDEEDEDSLFGASEPTPRAVPYKPDPKRGAPYFVGINGVGQSLFVLWRDGHLDRYTLSDFVQADGPAESQDLLDEGQTVTAASFVIGKMTLLVGDSAGGVRAWFETKPEDAGTIDGAVLRAAHSFEPTGSPVRVINPSARTRAVVVGHEDGLLRILQVTTENLLAEDRLDSGVMMASILPKNDALLAVTRDGLIYWDLDMGHPEATLGSLFGRVWYEGYTEPDSDAETAVGRGYKWESSGPTGFEPKYSLIPLIFGTLKATVYSIMIAAPIAFLAAIFTTEFLSPRLRAPIKSGVEMMAGLPSVVLGFLAALVIAPFVEDVVPAMLGAFVTVPFMLLLGSRAWQFLPTRKAIKWGGAPRFFSIALMIPAGIALAGLIGPWIENQLFWIERKVGDTWEREVSTRAWLSVEGGNPEVRSSGLGGWMFLCLPGAAVGVGVLWTLFGAPWMRSISTDWSRRKCATADIVKFTAMFAGMLLVSWIVAAILTFWGFDPRGGVLDTYAQRNALIVGFVMGFAVVPIIYTLAEDALSSVPIQLREGSLGCGATPWQTAWRITIPTAMSGLFGALMVGLGRAVGETMIVLMAAGNTGIMDWNIFNGFRTLSANIATEMPEAPKDGTHYRILFLAALVLFGMTFFVNMIAEAVRRIFRRRFADL